MTASHEITIQCPSCGRPHAFTMYDSITAGEDPELKERLLNGTLFHFTCSDCNKTFPILYPILYSDPEKKFMVQLSEPGKENEVLEGFEKAAPLRQGWTVRLVGQWNDLREKILLNDHDQNDLAAEMSKLIVLAGLRETEPDRMFDGVYYSPEDDGDWLILFENSAPCGKIAFPAELQEAMTQLLQKADPETIDPYHADPEHAAAILESLQDEI